MPGTMKYIISYYRCVILFFCRCVFLPNNGAFFIGYIITSAFIGSVVKLLRVSELLLYMVRRFRAKTRLQRELALKKVREGGRE